MVNGNSPQTKSFLGPNRQLIMILIRIVVVFPTISDMATLKSHTTI